MRMPLIALAAAAALAVPAAAQQQPGASQNQSTDQTGAADQGKEAQGQAARPTRSQTRMLQTQLNRMGLDAGPADGIMGTKTRAALEKFQTQKGTQCLGPDRPRDDDGAALASRTVRAGEKIAAGRLTSAPA